MAINYLPSIEMTETYWGVCLKHITASHYLKDLLDNTLKVKSHPVINFVDKFLLFYLYGTTKY